MAKDRKAAGSKAKGSKVRGSGKAGSSSKKSKAKATVQPSAATLATANQLATAMTRTALVTAEDGFSAALRAAPDIRLTDVSPSATPAFSGKKSDGEKLLAAMSEEVGALQERLYAESKGGGQRRLLLVVQGMDTSGKGGIMRHVVGAMDPQGVDLTSFKAPTDEERAHPFLWRIRNALPAAGQIGVFDRSHYEDVLIVRVRNLVPRAQWARRYAQINAFEHQVAAAGTTIIKVMLHISADEQKARLEERLDRPDKHWKFNPGDIDERQFWSDYQQAYQAALEKCSTDVAPWFVVPADHKWYARLAVQALVLEHLRVMDPQWPAADFDVEQEKARLALT